MIAPKSSFNCLYGCDVSGSPGKNVPSISVNIILLSDVTTGGLEYPLPRLTLLTPVILPMSLDVANTVAPVPFVLVILVVVIGHSYYLH